MRIEKLLKTLKYEFYKINFLQATLDAVILFLGLNILQTLVSINIHPKIADYKILAAITAVFLITNFIYRSKDYKIEIYEEENPELNELLRTAKDNAEKNNTASRALFDQIKDISRNVSSESIIPNNQILGKTLFIAVLSVTTVISGTMTADLSPDTFNNLVNDIEEEEELTQTGEFDYELKDGENVLGEPQDIDYQNMDMSYDTDPQEDVHQTSPFASQQELQNLRQFEEEARFDISRQYLERIRELDQ